MCRRNIYSYFFRVREAGSILLTSQIKGALLYAAFLVHLLCLSSQRTALQWWRPELDFPLSHLFKVFCPIMGIWTVFCICVQYWKNEAGKQEYCTCVSFRKNAASFIWGWKRKSLPFFWSVPTRCKYQILSFHTVGFTGWENKKCASCCF